MGPLQLRNTLLGLLTVLMVFLAGCGDDGDSDGTGDSTQTITDTTTETATETTTDTTTETTTTTVTSEPAYTPRNETMTLGSSIADCTVLAAAVAGGAPIGDAAGVVQFTINAADWGHSFTLVLTPVDPSGGVIPNPAASLCYSFDGGVGGLAAGDSGTIPADATTLYVGADGAPTGTVQFTTV